MARVTVTPSLGQPIGRHSVNDAEQQNLPQTVLAAFEGLPHLTLPEFSKASRMDPKTVRRHIAAGRLNWRDIGTGSVRVRRGFVLADVLDFYRSIKRGGTPCPSIGTETLPIGNSTSNSAVIAFPDQLRFRRGTPSAKRKPSRRKSVGRPSDLLRRSGSPAGSQ
jgi:hypothetical protein